MLFLSCKEELNTPFREENKTIILQPFNDFSKLESKILVDSLNHFFHPVILNSSIDIPKTSYVKDRNRYRADTIIRILRDSRLGDTITVGLTNFDISTSKNRIKDWGVMGLGYRPGKSCVISTFRLDKIHRKSQLMKVVLHEIGHTLGLPHCIDKECLMRDAEGGNPLNDEKDFCQNCRIRLKKKGMNID